MIFVQISMKMFTEAFIIKTSQNSSYLFALEKLILTRTSENNIILFNACP